jgi:sulfite exporter TauE/SafE
LSTTSAGTGMAYMALFGMGTIPLMLLTGWMGNFANARFRNTIKRMYPIFLVIFALLFLFRGLNFNVPGEFFFWEEMKDVPMCH